MASKLKSMYKGKHVVLYLTGMNVAIPGPDENQINVSSMIEGYVVDIDAEYVHLGDSAEEVNRSVRKDSIGIIELHEDTYEDVLLDEMENDGRVVN